MHHPFYNIYTEYIYRAIINIRSGMLLHTILDGHLSIVIAQKGLHYIEQVYTKCYVGSNNKQMMLSAMKTCAGTLYEACHGI